MSHQLITTIQLIEPVIASMSLVGICGENYPLEFGNYCRLKDGPYLCNMWAENLLEWVRRNPDSGPIEVTTVTHDGRAVGFVSDERLRAWYYNRLCVTGNGWPSVAAMRLVCDTLGAPHATVCGCEPDDKPARLHESWHTSSRHLRKFTCATCGRSWIHDSSNSPTDV